MTMEEWRFSTSAVPARQRGEHWRAMLDRVVVLGDLTIPDETAFTGTLFARRLGGGMLVADVASERFHVRHTARHLAAAGGDGVLICSFVAGSGMVRQGDVEIGFAPGDIVFRDAGAPSEVRLDSAMHGLVLKLPRARPWAPVDARGRLRAFKLSGASGLGAVIAALLRGTAAGLPDLEMMALPALETALRELAGAAVMTGLSPKPRDARWRAVCAAIEAELANPDLSVATIAAGQSLSARTVHKLFAAHGTSFGRHLLARRLERCRCDIEDPRQAGRGITEICFRWGFNDAAHFSRAFKLCYGLSPRAWRRR